MLAPIAAVVLPVLLALSVVLDLYGYYIKSTRHAAKQAQILAFGNWVIYLARMLNVVFAFVLAAMFESEVVTRLSVIFCSGFLLAALLVLIFMKTNKVERVLCYLLALPFYKPFNNLSTERFWRPVSPVMGLRGYGMFVSASFVYMALILPFVIAKLIPEFRMSAVFVGQLMNFASTAILLSYLEPRMMQFLDDKGKVGEIDGVIFGRIVLVLCMAVAMTGWAIVFAE